MNSSNCLPFGLAIFCGIVKDNATMSSVGYLKIMYRILCKTEGSRPY